MATAFITGINGFTGRHLSEALIIDGFPGRHLAAELYWAGYEVLELVYK